MNIEIKASAPASAQASSADDEAPRRGPEHPAVAPQNARVAELEDALGTMRDRWMRAEAETANVRARCKRDIEETRQFALQTFAGTVADAAENLRRGVDSVPAWSAHEPEIVTRLRDGFTGIERSFEGLLARNGIVRHDPTGKPFDPDLHQAMDQQVTAAHAPGTVLQAWTSAWTLNGRLLRPAMVVVSTA